MKIPGEKKQSGSEWEHFFYLLVVLEKILTTSK